MKSPILNQLISILLILVAIDPAISQVDPSEIQFVRQGVKRLIFEESQSISLAKLEPENIIGIASMHPARNYSGKAEVQIADNLLLVSSQNDSETGIWFGSFNPFATYFLDYESLSGKGELGFEFSSPDAEERFIVSLHYENQQIKNARLKIVKSGHQIYNDSILSQELNDDMSQGRIILQMLGSGLNLFLQQKGKPTSIGQSDFSDQMDLRKKSYIQSLQSRIYVKLSKGKVKIRKAESALTTGLGQADIRAITYKDGSPFLDKGRLWYTISIRGRALPHHTQGVFSMDPSVFDIRLEGVIVFDRGDDILRNEISSHLFYDPEQEIWQGLTTGFSAFARDDEEKQILAIESKKDPRFGFSIMKARPTGIVGDIEDSHILFDEEVQKWRLLTCENHKGYKAVILESDSWDKDYKRIAGPVAENSTGTSIQQIGEKRFCFSGSSAREVFIYSYPELDKVGTLQMDLAPWDTSSRTRIWPNVIMLPEGYPSRYVALMMDRYNYPGQKGPHWSYGALYLYFGY